MTPGELVTALGYAVGALVFFLAARRRELATEGVGYVALAGLLGGLIFAKLTQWLLGDAPGFSSILDPRLGGRALVGGVIGGWVCVEIAKRRLGIRRSTGDLWALALPAGEAVGRIGCFFNGCCYGTPTTLAWAVEQHGATRHPAQLYSAIFAAGLFALLAAWRDKLPREGDLFRLYLALWALGRFVLEFWRDRSVGVGGLSLVQWICLETIAALFVAFVLARRRAQTTRRPRGAAA